MPLKPLVEVLEPRRLLSGSYQQDPSPPPPTVHHHDPEEITRLRPMNFEREQNGDDRGGATDARPFIRVQVIDGTSSLNEEAEEGEEGHLVTYRFSRDHIDTWSTLLPMQMSVTIEGYGDFPADSSDYSVEGATSFVLSDAWDTHDITIKVVDDAKVEPGRDAFGDDDPVPTPETFRLVMTETTLYRVQGERLEGTGIGPTGGGTPIIAAVAKPTVSDGTRFYYDIDWTEDSRPETHEDKFMGSSHGPLGRAGWETRRYWVTHEWRREGPWYDKSDRFGDRAEYTPQLSTGESSTWGFGAEYSLDLSLILPRLSGGSLAVSGSYSEEWSTSVGAAKAPVRSPETPDTQYIVAGYSLHQSIVYDRFVRYKGEAGYTFKGRELSKYIGAVDDDHSYQAHLERHWLDVDAEKVVSGTVGVSKPLPNQVPPAVINMGSILNMGNTLTVFDDDDDNEGLFDVE